MKNRIFIYFTILCSLLSLCFGNEVNIGIIKTDYADLPYVNYIKNKFPELVINTKVESYNETISMKSFIESVFNKPKKYDIIFYESMYINILAPYLSNLNQLPKEYLNMYDAKTLNETSIFRNELYGLPVHLNYEVLYSHEELLTKYNKSIPRTWDELIQTCKYIQEKENNPELKCYNGSFENNNQGSYSLYQFIYSCRDSINSPYPNPQDKSFVNALMMLKKIKNEVASDEIFSSDDGFTFASLLDGNSIFLKYWVFDQTFLVITPYNYSILPGLKEGISGSMVKGINISIAKDIPKEKEKNVIDVFYYVISKEFQKNVFIDNMDFPGTSELLNDESLCNEYHCNVIKYLQVTGEPKFIKEGPEGIKKDYKNIIYQFLYKNETIEETVKKLSEYDTNNSSATSVSILLLLVICILSVKIVF